MSVALTSEACLKGLPKTTAGEVVAFKGWPKLQWFVTEHLAKTPKDWLPPPKLTDDTPAYIEVSKPSITSFPARQSLATGNERFVAFAVHYGQRRFGDGSDGDASRDALALSHPHNGMQLHGGREHGLRARFQTGSRTLAQHHDERSQRNARYFHTIRFNEGQSRFVDADDHQVQR